ncbi:40S ribosomal protein S24 [Anaeramoeba flamelloides]|uniref:40S ribosomal protein S24 n=1 Tax=Anaeramoeba flamelloides TaxID=1746091 RepID=A0ABQ8XIJ0_9EUKA|nr:40S ribosomal protein S24 [Anaeramoeba flamelloides]
MSTKIKKEGTVTVRTRRVMSNILLRRKQMIIDILHPGLANVSKEELRQRVGRMYHLKDPKCVQLFGFKTVYGGGRSSGFCLIYDDAESMMKFEPKYRLIRLGLLVKPETNRRAKKDRKNKGKKFRGKFKFVGGKPKKKKKDDD